jgi:hypothetical protein
MSDDAAADPAAAAADTSGKCAICDAPGDNVNFCRPCARANATAVFTRGRPSIKSILEGLNATDQQITCLLQYGHGQAKVNELCDDYLRKGVAQQLLALCANDIPARNKIVHKLRDCLLSQACRLILSVKDRIRLSTELTACLSDEEQAEAAQVRIVVVNPNAPIAAPTEAQLARNLYIYLNTLSDDYETELNPHEIQLHESASRDKAFGNLNLTAYVYKLLALLHFEIERQEEHHAQYISDEHSYLRKVFKSVQHKRRKATSEVMKLFGLAPQLPSKRQGDAAGAASAGPKKKKLKRAAPTASGASGGTAGGSAGTSSATTSPASSSRGSGASSSRSFGASSSRSFGASSSRGLGASSSRDSSQTLGTLTPGGRGTRKSMSAALKIPLEKLRQVPTEVELKVPPAVAQTGDAWLGKLLARKTRGHASHADCLVLPHVFTNLAFSNTADIDVLVANRRNGWPKPQHLTVIVGLEDVYRPLFHHIARRDPIFSELRTLTILVQAEYKDPRRYVVVVCHCCSKESGI